LQNRDCANLIPKIENIEDICREMLKWYLKDYLINYKEHLVS
jgi:hypothetical protein